MTRNATTARAFALTFGAVYVLVGAVGFAVTGFDGLSSFAANGDQQLLIFDINPFHNVVHLGVGAIWMAAAAVSAHRPNLIYGVNFGIAGVYALATVLGFAGGLTALSIDAGLAPDNFLHLATAAVALYFTNIPAAVTNKTNTQVAA